MSSDTNLNLLKNIVIIMGFTLVIGVVILFKLIFNKLQASSNDCPRLIEIDKKNAQHASYHTDKIILHFIQKDQERFEIYDECSGIKLREIILK